MRPTLREKVLAYADAVAEADVSPPAEEVEWKLRSIAGEWCSERLCRRLPEDGYSTCERHTQESYMRQYG
jgi:hypothetical protein